MADPLPWRAAAMNQPRRILHLISRLDGYGGARMLRYLAASQAASGARVMVAALHSADGVAQELLDRGVAVQVLGSRWQVDPIAAALVARLQRSMDLDVVHAWDVAAMIQAGVSRRRTRTAMVAMIDASQTQRRWSARAVRTFRNRVDAVVAEDEPTQAWLRRQGVSEQRLRCIRPGVPPLPARGRDHADWLASLGLPADAKVIAIAGPLVRSKKLDEAIWAYELVRVLHPTARMIILGDGPDRARLQRFADDVSEPGCIRFLGYRPNIAELLPHADVFWQLNASRSTPLALLEAQVAAVPVVASEAPAHRTAVAPDRTGWLVPLDNRAEVARATDELFGNRERAERIGAAGAQNVGEHWSLDAALASYERLYERLGAQPI